MKQRNTKWQKLKTISKKRAKLQHIELDNEDDIVEPSIRQKQNAPDVMADGEKSLEDRTAALLLAESIREYALKELTKEQYVVYQLVAEQGYTYREAADTLQRSKTYIANMWLYIQGKIQAKFSY